PSLPYTCLVFFLLVRPPPRSPLFPYTTLFRSFILPQPSIVAASSNSAGMVRINCTSKNMKNALPKKLGIIIGLNELNHPNLENRDRKSTRLNSSHVKISYAVFCLKKKKNIQID